jgi:hypothetical protein
MRLIVMIIVKNMFVNIDELMAVGKFPGRGT